MQQPPKTYLVTGGAGFIGSNFVKYLTATYGAAVRVVIVDKLTYAGNLSTIAPELELDNVQFVHADINDATAMDRVLADEDPAFVINFAAESHVDRSITGPRVFLETNIMGTQTLLEACRRHWTLPSGGMRSGVKYVQISTDEVYGSLSRDFDEPRPLEISQDLRRVVGQRHAVTYGTTLFTESTPLAPRSPYSASKASADMMTLAYADTYGLPVNVTRCSNNYGPWHFPEKLIPLMINNILEGRELPVYGRGLNVRDWLYVGDHVRAIDLVTRQGQPGEVYNIGGLNEKANIDIVGTIIELVAEMTGSRPRHDLIRHVRDRAGHDMRYAIDPSKTAAALGWAPLTPFETGIRSTVRWNLDNRGWIESITSGDYRNYYQQMYHAR